MTVGQFGPNITVDGSSLGPRAAVYQREVLEQLTQLMIFDTGRILLGEIRRRPQRIRIVPQPPGATPADTGPVSWADSAPRGVQPLDGTGQPIAGPRGTGLGSDVVIRYTPASWGTDAGGWTYGMQQSWQALTGNPPPAPGDDRGETLVHELVHAYRDTLGVSHCRPMGLGFDTREEVIAIAVANLYGLERLRPLRATHNGGTLPNYHQHMMTRDFRNTLFGTMAEMPALTNALARVDVRPNLFAQYAVPNIRDVFFGSHF